MIEKYVKSFVDSAINIIYSMTSIHIYQVGDAVQNYPLANLNEVTLLVGITGQLKGRVLINMSPLTAFEIASIMNNEKRDQFDELTTSTLTELANIIIAHAITDLNREDFGLDLSPPTMLLGDHLHIFDDKINSWVAILNFHGNEILFNIALVEKKK